MSTVARTSGARRRGRQDLTAGYESGHTSGMKIAISVPDPIYRAAEKAARRLRVPRSQFYSRAVQAYLRQASREDVTERLNAVYGDEPGDPDPFLEAATKRTFLRTRW